MMARLTQKLLGQIFDAVHPVTSNFANVCPGGVAPMVLLNKLIVSVGHFISGLRSDVIM
jgi:hypothetical protein